MPAEISSEPTMNFPDGIANNLEELIRAGTPKNYRPLEDIGHKWGHPTSSKESLAYEFGALSGIVGLVATVDHESTQSARAEYDPDQIREEELARMYRAIDRIEEVVRERSDQIIVDKHGDDSVFDIDTPGELEEYVIYEIGTFPNDLNSISADQAEALVNGLSEDVETDSLSSARTDESDNSLLEVLESAALEHSKTYDDSELPEATVPYVGPVSLVSLALAGAAIGVKLNHQMRERGARRQFQIYTSAREATDELAMHDFVEDTEEIIKMNQARATALKETGQHTYGDEDAYGERSLLIQPVGGGAEAAERIRARVFGSS